VVQSWQEIFPRSVEFLNQKGQSSLLVEFESELDSQNLFASVVEPELISQDWTFREQARWFPAFLKIKSCPTYWLEIAEFEYLQFAAKNLDFGSPAFGARHVSLHPSAQFVELRHDHAELNRGRGLYCFVRKGAKFFELQLSIYQALILDLVQQGLVLSVDHLVSLSRHHFESMENRSLNQPADWRELVDQLGELGILVRPDQAHFRA